MQKMGGVRNIGTEKSAKNDEKKQSLSGSLISINTLSVVFFFHL